MTTQLALFDMSGQFDLEDWKVQRDAILDAHDASMGLAFRANARAFVMDYLRTNGQSSGEDITDACKASGLEPRDDRAFGAVYMSLVRDGTIEVCGMCIRKKGHGSGGGKVWRLRVNAEVHGRRP